MTNTLAQYFPEDEEEFLQPFKSADTATPVEGDDDLSVGDVALDLVAAPFRGAVGAIESIAELGNIIPGVEYDIPDYFGVPMGQSSTIAGQFIESATQFALPFFAPGVGGLALASKAGRLAKMANPTSRAILGMSKRGNLVGAGALKFGRRLARDTFGGALVDFAAFDPSDGRLSDLLQDIPGLSNPVIDYLASNDEDTEAEGRFKMALEGAGLGIIFDGLISGLKGIKIAKAHYAKHGDVDLARKFMTEELERLQVDDLANSFNLSHKEAVAVNSIISHMGVDRTKLQIGGKLPYIGGYGQYDEADNLFQSVYHASNANFSEFKMDKVSKGWLKHGHGLYFAVDKNTAEGYLPEFSGDFGRFVDGKRLEAMNDIRRGGPSEMGIASEVFWRDVGNPRIATEELYDKYPKYTKTIDDLAQDRSTDIGYLYRVEIKDDAVVDFWNIDGHEQTDLNWQRLSEAVGQPVETLKALRGGGKAIYQRLRHRLLKEGATVDDVDKQITDLLASKGIKGAYSNEGVFIAYDTEALRIAGRDGRGVGPQVINENLLKWAGKTKAATKDGVPVVYYHGTRAASDFDVIDPDFGELGFHVGTRRQAQARIAKVMANEFGAISGDRVMPLFVRAENPLRISDVGVFDLDNVDGELARHLGTDDYHLFDDLMIEKDPEWRDLDIDQAGWMIRASLKEMGYDSIVYRNQFEDGVRGHDSYILFEPNQVKSAMGNSGEYGLDEKSILAQLGQRDAKGISIFREGKSFIAGLNNPDVSTAIHEVFHVARRTILDPEAPVSARAGITDDDLRTIYSYAMGRRHNADPDVIYAGMTVDGEEKLARAFEGYIHTGKIPEDAPPKLYRAMEKLSRFIRKVYRSATNSPLITDIPDDVRKVFDRLSTRSVRAFGGAFPELARSAGEGTRMTLFQSEKQTVLEVAQKLADGEGPQAPTQSGKPGESYLNRLRMTDDEDVQLATDALYETLLNSDAIKRSDKFTNEQLKDAVMDILGDPESNIYLNDGKPMRLDWDYLTSNEGVAAMRDLHIDLQVKRAINRSLVEELHAIAIKGDGASMEEAVQFLVMRENAAKLAESIHHMTAEAGRMLQSHNIVPERKGIPAHLLDPEALKDPTSMEKLLSDFGQGDPRRGLAKVRAEMTVFAATPPAGRVKLMRDRKSGVFQMIMEYWMNSILSGPITGAVNTLSGAFMTILKPIEKFIGHAATGRWAQARQDLMRYGTMLNQLTESLRIATRVGFGQASLDAGARVVEGPLARQQRAISAGGLADTLAKGRINIDEKGVFATGFDFLGKVINMPSRLLQGTDELFKQLNWRSDLKARLYSQGMQDGMTDPNEIEAFVRASFDKATHDGQLFTQEAVRRRVAQEAKGRTFGSPQEQHRWMTKRFGEIWDDESEELAKQSMEALGLAREATFTTPITQKGRNVLVRFAGEYSRAVEHLPIARFLTPFTRTPTNLIAAAFNRTPVIAGWDVLKAGRRSLMEEMTQENVEKRADAIGRVATSFAFVAIGFGAVMENKMTGGGPRNKDQLDALKAAGWQPYSIKIGGKWVSYQRLDPVSTMVGLIADFYETWAHAPRSMDNEMMDMVNAGILSMTRNLTNKSYLKGLMEFMNALSDERMGGTGERVAQTTRSLMASFVPTLSSQLNQIDDPYLREARNLTEAMARRTYGMSDELPPRRDLFGKPILRNPAIGPDWLSPFNYSVVADDVVRKEFAKVGHGFAQPRADRYGIDLTQFVNEDGRDAYDRWLELHGEVKVGGLTMEGALKRVIGSASYQRLEAPADDAFSDPRVERLNRVIQRYRDAAYEEVMREFPTVRAGTKNFQAAQKAYRSGRPVDQILRLMEQQ